MQPRFSMINSKSFTCELSFEERLDGISPQFRAPMKALASEITRKLGKRLAWLKIKVRELTGAFTAISTSSVVNPIHRGHAVDESRDC